MDRIAVLIPCYNEKVTIKKVINDFKNYLPNAIIYVYDNNSSDKSDEIAQNNGAIVRYERKQGKGNVVRTMFRDIDAECYVIVDADDTYSLSKVNEMCEYILNDGYDMVIGDRLSSQYFSENKRPFHNIGNAFVRFIINKFFKTNIKDIMTGFRCMSYNFVKTFPVLSKGFEIETEMTIHAVYRNMNIKNVVIDYKDRTEESPSKLNTVSDGIKVIFTFFKLYKNYKPLQFFSIVSLIMAIISTILFIPILIEFRDTGLVPKFPTLIMCGFIYLTAIISYFSGLILSSIVEKDKRDFENYLNIVNRLKYIVP